MTSTPLMDDVREAGPVPRLAMPPRPERPLSTLGLLRTFPANSLAACDEGLFDELFVARHFWIDAVQLPESDPLEPEPLTARDGLLAQVVRASIPLPFSGTGSC